MNYDSHVFFNQLIKLDFAYLNEFHQVPIGQSYDLNVHVVGKLSKIDLNQLKESCQTILKEYDHKLWIPDDYNKKDSFINVYEEDGEIEIDTSCFLTICPTQSVKMIDLYNLPESLSYYLEMELRVIYPQGNIKVRVEVEEPWKISDHSLKFNLIHGLKSSVNQGEQNINHGHSCWFTLYDQEDQKIVIPINFYNQLLNKDLNKIIFIHHDHVIFENQKQIQVGYKTEQGYFEVFYQKDKNNLCILNKEPCINHITQWFIDTYYKELQSMKAYSVRLIEGLSTGCIQIIK